jgi:transposase-like protein
MASKRRGSEDPTEAPARSAGGTSGPDGGSVDAAASAPDPEVSEKPTRRRYPAEYKLRILKELDACTEPGEVGAFLRREGLYSSLVSTWRRQRDEGSLKALAASKRGRKPKPSNPLSRRVEDLEREKKKLERRLKQAQTVIEVQKKLSEILGLPLTETPERGSD